jgi:serine O-acetyltransferase
MGVRTLRPRDQIRSRADYRRFLEADLRAHGLVRRARFDILRRPELRFQRLLRRVEYLENCRRGPAGRLLFLIAWVRLRRRSIRLGFSIPRHVFGPGLSLAHYGSVIVNGDARVGRNCRIHPGVVIGELDGRAPTIGDDVYIGPGAKLYGGISIGDGAAVGANAVVNRDVPAGVAVAGIPARPVSDRGSDGLLHDTVLRNQ